MYRLPFFTVVTPTHNRREFLEIAVNSVLNQSFRDFEFIIIDDGSTDETSTYLESIDDERLKVKRTSGIERSAARNLGVKEAVGQFVCFLDDDDYYLENHLAVFHEKIDSFDGPTSILFSNHQLKEGVKFHPVFTHPANHSNTVRFIWEASITLLDFCIPLKILENELFPPQFNMWEDKHLLSRLALNYPIISTNELTSVLVQHSDRSVNLISNDSFIAKLHMMPNALDDLLKSYENELRYLIDNAIIRKQKSIYAIGKALDALEHNEPKLAWRALSFALRFFTFPLILTYLNTYRKILFSRFS